MTRVSSGGPPFPKEPRKQSRRAACAQPLPMSRLRLPHPSSSEKATEISSAEPYWLRAGPAAIRGGGTYYLPRTSSAGRTEVENHPNEENHTKHQHCTQPLARSKTPPKICFPTNELSPHDLTENDGRDFARMRRFFSPQALLPRVPPASLIAPNSDTFLGGCRSTMTSGRRIQQRPQSADKAYINEGSAMMEFNDNIRRVGSAHTVANGLRVLGLELPRCRKRGKVQAVEDAPSKTVTRRMNATSWETPQGGAVVVSDKALDDVELQEVGSSAPTLPGKTLNLAMRKRELAKQDLRVKRLASSATLDEKAAVFPGKGMNATMKSSEEADLFGCSSRQCIALREPNTWKTPQESSFEASRSKLTVEAVGRIGVAFDRSGTLQFVEQVNVTITNPVNGHRVFSRLCVD